MEINQISSSAAREEKKKQRKKAGLIMPWTLNDRRLMSRSKAVAACLSDEWRFTKNRLLFTWKLLKSINHLKYREETFRNTCAIMGQRYEHLLYFTLHLF